MTILVVQFLLASIAALGTWRLYRSIVARDRVVGLFAAIGFLARAVAGQILFWISYLELPFGRSLQSGNGLWFFSIDGGTYLRLAAAAADAGILQILTYPRSAPSVTQIQVLSVGLMLFGSLASVALFLNLIWFLGSMAILGRLASEPAGQKGARIAAVAVSLAPAGILWSLQPLKESLFQFLLIAFLTAFIGWQSAWRENRRGGGLWAAAIMLVAMLGIAGLRWYVAFTLLALAAVFFVLCAATAQGRKLLTLASSIPLLILLAQAFVVSARPYVPDFTRVPFGPTQIIAHLDENRGGFDRTPGSTAIGMGRTLARLEQPSVASADTGAVGSGVDAQRAGEIVEARPGEAAVPSTSQSPPAPAPPEESATATPPLAASSSPTQEHAAPPDAVSVQPPPSVSVNPPPAVSVQPPPSVSVQSPPSVSVQPPPAVSLQPPALVDVPPPPAAVPATATAPSMDQAAPDAGVVVFPRSRAVRLAAGLTALFLPHKVGESLGLLELGGGRGFWWFADFDTIAFGLAMLFIASFALTRWRLASPGNAAFWVVLLFTLLLAGSLAYTISNFGTLFRLRMIVYTAASLLPLTLSVFAGKLKLVERRPEALPVTATDSAGRLTP